MSSFSGQLHAGFPRGHDCRRITLISHSNQIYLAISCTVTSHEKEKRCFPKICAEAIVIFVVAK